MYLNYNNFTRLNNKGTKENRLKVSELLRIDAEDAEEAALL